MSDWKDGDRSRAEVSGSRGGGVGYSRHQARAGSHNTFTSRSDGAGRRRDKDRRRVSVGHWERVEDRGRTGVALGGSSGSAK